MNLELNVLAMACHVEEEDVSDNLDSGMCQMV